MRTVSVSRVTRELSVDWIVGGSVRIDLSQLLASVELTGPGGTCAGWPEHLYQRAIDLRPRYWEKGPLFEEPCVVELRRSMGL